jgi:hypothetical protein
MSVATKTVLAPLVWKRSPNFSSRHGVYVDLVVYHETAGHYPSDVAWLCNPKSQASAHLVVREDGGQVTQLVRLDDKAWTQAFYNPRAIGVEHSNITAKGYSTEQQLRESARIFGWLLELYELPTRFARGGVGRGVCRHLDLGVAGGGHTQCGMGDRDLARWLQMIHDERARGGYKRDWARL